MQLARYILIAILVLLYQCTVLQRDGSVFLFDDEDFARLNKKQ